MPSPFAGTRCCPWTTVSTRCQKPLPHLARSALPRCFQRHNGSRLSLRKDGEAAPKKKCKDYPSGYLPVNFAEVQTEEGRQYLFVALDRPSQGAFAEWQPQAKRMVAADFLRRVLEKLPYQAHTVLPTNGVQVTLQPHQFFPGGHSLARVGRAFGGAHRLTKPAHPWTNGQVERFNRTSKAATGPRYHYESAAQLKEHLQTF